VSGARAPARDSSLAYLIGLGKWFDLTNPAALHVANMEPFNADCHRWFANRQSTLKQLADRCDRSSDTSRQFVACLLEFSNARTRSCKLAFRQGGVGDWALSA